MFHVKHFFTATTSAGENVEKLFKMWKTFQDKIPPPSQDVSSNINRVSQPLTLPKTEATLRCFLTSRAHISRSSPHFLSHRFCKNSCTHFTILKEFVFTDDVSRETIFHQCGVFVENCFRKDVAYSALKNKNRGKNPGCLMCFCKNRFPSTFSIL